MTLAMYLEKPTHDEELRVTGLIKTEQMVFAQFLIFLVAPISKRIIIKAEQNRMIEWLKVAVSVSPYQQLQDVCRVLDASGLPYPFLEMSTTRLYYPPPPPPRATMGNDWGDPGPN